MPSKRCSFNTSLCVLVSTLMIVILDCFDQFLLFPLDCLFDWLATDWKHFSFVLFFYKKITARTTDHSQTGVKYLRNNLCYKNPFSALLSSPSRWRAVGSTSGGPLDPTSAGNQQSRLMWSTPAFSRPRQPRDPLGLPQNNQGLRGQIMLKSVDRGFSYCIKAFNMVNGLLKTFYVAAEYDRNPWYVLVCCPWARVGIQKQGPKIPKSFIYRKYISHMSKAGHIK